MYGDLLLMPEQGKELLVNNGEAEEEGIKDVHINRGNIKSGKLAKLKIIILITVTLAINNLGKENNFFLIV